MRIRKIFIVLIFLCFIVSLAGVSAGENENMTEISQENDIDSNGLEAETPKDVVNPIDELDSKIQNSKPGDVIRLDENYSIPNTTKTNGIDIYTNNITIDGQGHMIDGNLSDMDYLFRIHEDNVVMKNIIFTNLESVDSYNAIEWMGDFGKLVNCTFINNYGFRGGAVDLTGYNGEIINCTFTSNIAEMGGAILLYGSQCSVLNCTFQSNIASEGGAVYVLGRSNTISKCHFDNNSADDGGAIYWDNILGNLTDCTFTNNQAEKGGAVFTTSFESNIVNCEFKNNSADGTAGAIYWSANGGNIINCTFTNNNATMAGAVYGDTNDDIFVNNSVFTNNTAKEFGGALFIEDDGYVENSVFKNNSASLGGALYSDVECQILNATFTGNSAKTGGAIAIVDGAIINSTLTENRATESGGALMCAGEVLVNGTDFRRNSAADGSNAIVLMDASNLIIGNVTSDTPLAYKLMNITASIPNVTYTEQLKISVNLNHNITGGKLYILINNKIYSFNVTNGIVNAKISNLVAGTYKIKLFYNCSDYSTQIEEYTANVLKKNVTITMKSAIFVINYAKKYGIILRDSTGKAMAGEKVIFYINNKRVGTAITNRYGVAYITLTAKTLHALKYGTKTMKIAINSNYNPSSKAVKIAVTKEKTKFYAAKKTFKQSVKYKKYTIKVKNSKNKGIKNVKVTLKVKGKTYKAKSNARGFATFYISKLFKKGKHTAVIKYSGGKYYRAVTQKVRLTIR